MDDDIIRVPLERQMRPISPHPQIKRIMQKQIGQQGADDSPNAKDNLGSALIRVTPEDGAGDPFEPGPDCGIGIEWRSVIVSLPTRTSFTSRRRICCRTAISSTSARTRSLLRNACQALCQLQVFCFVHCRHLQRL